MSVANAGSSSFTVVLNEEERALLATLVEQAIRETHVEARRTEAPDFQEQVHHQEHVLRSVIDKLRRP
jgi:acetate kinase